MFNKLIFLLLLSMIFIVPISLACNQNEYPIRLNNVDYCVGSCNGAVVEQNGQLQCIACEPNFVLQDGSCVPKSYVVPQMSMLNQVDEGMRKMFPANPAIGYGLLILLLGIGIYFGFLKKKK